MKMRIVTLVVALMLGMAAPAQAMTQKTADKVYRLVSSTAQMGLYFWLAKICCPVRRSQQNPNDTTNEEKAKKREQSAPDPFSAWLCLGFAVAGVIMAHATLKAALDLCVTD